MDNAQELIAAKTITITKLMDVVPDGTSVSKTAFHFNTTFC